jgi:hypothetical protein
MNRKYSPAKRVVNLLQPEVVSVIGVGTYTFFFRKLSTLSKQKNRGSPEACLCQGLQSRNPFSFNDHNTKVPPKKPSQRPVITEAPENLLI